MKYIPQEKPKHARRNIIIATAAVAVVALLLVTGVLGGGARKLSATRLKCSASQSVTPFGDRILYYDGMDMHCLNAHGGELWSYTLGAGAGFSCDTENIVAWKDNQVYIINKNGRNTYNANLSETIQFARVGSKYIAIVIGKGSNPSLLFKDLVGVTLDSEAAVYEGLVMLDMGFFSDGEYLWTTALDAYGTVPSTVMNTYRVGQLNTGSVDLGEYITYAIVYAGNRLNVIDTRQLRKYDHRGTPDATGTVLVYGWQLICSDASGSNAMLLFAPVRQTSQVEAIVELRLLYGSTDQRYSLPDTCLGAALYNRRIYAFSDDSLFRADVNSQRFTALSLPLDGGVTAYLGMCTNGTALLACGTDVYAVSVP